MKWEYHLVHLNFYRSLSKSDEGRNLEASTQKLEGSLSPDFLKE